VVPILGDADRLVLMVTTTAANEAEVDQVANLLHDKAKQVWPESG
jgi:IS5 family transposase